jgi:hypothetical protein
MKQIPLTRGLFALVDDQDYPFLSQFNWFAWVSKNGRFYAGRGRAPVVWMHRVLLPGVAEVDHKNTDSLDNQRFNLRPATRGQNCANARVRKDSKSGFKGVTWNPDQGAWRVRICVDYQIHHLGYFSDPAKAARVYDAEALKQFGEFACVNFPK